MHDTSLILTLTPLASVVAHELLLLLYLLKLHAYAPMYSALIDPPYEFAPKEPTELVVKALQSVQDALFKLTVTPLAVVASHELLLPAAAASL
jgi:hypothetical protein